MCIRDRAGGCEAEGGDGGAAEGGGAFGVIANIAGEKNDIGHFLSPLLVRGAVPPNETRP